MEEKTREGARPKIFVSYNHRDVEIATELASRLTDAGFDSFVAERDIKPTEEWELKTRDEVRNADCVIILLTPRSRDSKWVAIETGAAWALGKPLVPATMFVDSGELGEPLSKHQAFPIETSAQVAALIQGLQNRFEREMPADLRLNATPQGKGERFCERSDWDRLQKIGDWQFDDGIIRGGGVNKYLLSHFAYGERPFHVSAQMRFAALQPRNAIAAVNAGIVFGFRAIGSVLRYYHLMFTGTRILLELIGAHDGPVFRDFQHIGEGVLFTLEPGRLYAVDLLVEKEDVELRVDGIETYTAQIQQQNLNGRVGLRPWRSRIDSHRFDVLEL